MRWFWPLNLCVLLCGAAIARGDAPPPMLPQESLQAMQLRPGFEVELVVAEPLVMDPIAMDWGPDGRLWVVEMADYPLGLDDKGKPGGRVRVLQQNPKTGRYDQSKIFLDDLPFPTDVLVWGKGVLITAAPDVIYAEDTDGDGRADVRRVLFTGFNEGNQQHRVNGLRGGLDNWVYLANGDSNGKIKSVATGQVVDLAGRDLRIRPDDGRLEAQCGMTQYGRNRDEWDNWFGCNNSQPLWHYPFGEHYLRRNPFVAPPAARVTLAGNQPIFPISRVVSHYSQYKPPAAGQASLFTSACSAMIYTDDLFGPDFANNAFISEPVHNLIHRQVLTPDGISFQSHRANDEADREFLRSKDSWFRPTTIRTGPDGALWIADMYRIVMEHPQWINAKLTKTLNLREGHDKGRIYRVFPTGQRPRPIPNVTGLDTLGLVAALDSPSGWQRDVVQRMLISKGDRAAVEPLRSMTLKHERPLARVHALATLDGLSALTPEFLIEVLRDPHPGVRRQAVRLTESFLDESPALVAALGERLQDDDPRVRLQLACSLGATRDPRAGRLLGELASRHANDRALLSAIASSWHKHNLGSVLSAFPSQPVPGPLLEPLIRSAVGFEERTVFTELLSRLTTAPSDNFTASQMSALGTMLDVTRSHVPFVDAEQARIVKVQQYARKLAADDNAAPKLRMAALALLGRDASQPEQDAALLTDLLSARRSPEIQSAALTAIGRFEPSRVPPLLLAGWRGYLPALRSQVLELLLSRDPWTDSLLQAMDDKTILAGQLDATLRQRLIAHKREAVRKHAAVLFAAASSGNRQQVVARHQDVLNLTGDLTRGKAAFAKRCSACHQLEGVGHKLGADLAGSKDKSPQALLVAILDPNQAVEGRYTAYVAVTADGRTMSGLLTEEASTSVTLTSPDGKAHVLLRTDLDELQSTGKSFMPEGLEVDLNPQDLADVIAYVRAATQPKSPSPSVKPRS